MCRFKIQLKTSPEVLYQKALSIGRQHKATMYGNTHEGSFEVKLLGYILRGKYYVMSNVLNVEITSKPLFISCKAIEKAIVNFI